MRWRYGGVQHSQKFDRKRDAQAFEAKQKALIQSNSFTPPSRGRITLSELSLEWFATRSVSERTLHDYREIWSNTIEPTWGSIRIDQIKPDAIKGWLASLSRRYSSARVQKSFTVFKQMLDFAVMGERIESNPAMRAKALAGRWLLPKPDRRKSQRHLTAEEVFLLASQDSTLEPMILIMAFTGMRFGEVTALRVRDVDLLRGRLLVQQAISDVAGRLILGPPKSGLAREVPLPRLLRDMLGALLGSAGGPDELVFKAEKGGPIRYKTWRAAFERAVQSSGLPRLTTHDLRHTYAALSIHAGVGPKALQEAMGHSDIRLTMDTYAALFDEDRDDHASRLDAVAREAFTKRSSPNVPRDSQNNPKSWSRLGDLNPGPTHYECVALPLS